MGRITRSFRMNFQEELRSLRRTFRDALMDPSRRSAFDSLVKAWGSEMGAMSYVRIPSVLEIMLLTAIVDNRKLIQELSARVGVVKSRIEKIGSRLEEIL